MLGNFLRTTVGASKKVFNSVSIKLASPDLIRSWSCGEVIKPDTVNYRTTKPEKDGLFCCKIYGPIKDYECLCGKYKRPKHRGIVCEKCDVEVMPSSERRRRMGHIELAAPVTHIWFFKPAPSRIATLLDIPLICLEKVQNFESYIVINPGLSHFRYGDLIDAPEVEKFPDKYIDGEFGSFEIGIGNEAIMKMLQELDLEEHRYALRKDLSSGAIPGGKRKKIARRLQMIEDFIRSGNKPDWMILNVLPVIPPDLRPLVHLEGGRFATSDLNELYRRVINRNNRLRRLIELRAPDIIIRNEKRMLQEAVDALLDNGRRSRVLKSNNKKPYKSLADMLKGKQGRFRQNLLGKRVDYSGRSVIVVGPELKLHQCGLPKKMALELFKPFVMAKLVDVGLAQSLKEAKKMIENELPDVFEILNGVISQRLVLLNRAPTLHRLGIQAFEPVLIEGQAIQVHPLVCNPFNADFDGDQMAVHVPLSVEAQLEARLLMMVSNNILSPANGKPVIVPSQDMILGLYYMTLEMSNQKGEGLVFSGISEVEHALHNKYVSLHAKIRCKYGVVDVDGKIVHKLVDTTPGRLILSEAFPAEAKLPFDMINCNMSKKEIASLIEIVLRRAGQKLAVIFADKIMELGFKYATVSGVSFGKDDMVVPPTKEGYVAKAWEEIKQYEAQYSEGLITKGEKFNKSLDTWSRCTENVGNDTMLYNKTKEEIVDSLDGRGPMPVQTYTSIYLMTDSGARGSIMQIKQLCGMRGLIARSNDEIVSVPILSNFKDGLTVIEYFFSTHGARKGLSDTALKTSNSGYLTRKLVDVAHECTIMIPDCGTVKGIIKRTIFENGEVVVPLRLMIIGRIVAEDLYHKVTGALILAFGGEIDEKIVDIIEEAGIDAVRVRSALFCESSSGICAKCYGRDYSKGKLVECGTAVGVIAAQSIGEPGTQLTMRTFHMGGAAYKSKEQSDVTSFCNGEIRFVHANIVLDSNGNKIVMSRNFEIVLVDDVGCEKIRYKVPYGAKLFVSDYDKVCEKQKLAEWDSFTIPIITERSGRVSFVDLYKGVTFQEIHDEFTGVVNYVVTNNTNSGNLYRDSSSDRALQPSIAILNDDMTPITLANGANIKYFIPVGAILNVKDGDAVHAGDIVARVLKKSSKSSDITGGLSRIIELTEVRRPKDHSIMAEIAGRVEFGKDYKSKRRLIIRPIDDEKQAVEYFIPRGKHITVCEGDIVEKGDMLMEGTPSPREILKVMGVEKLCDYMVGEMQQVYRLQGVVIDDKHIEIILRQMLDKVEILDPGETTFLVGELVSKEQFASVNENAIKEGYAPATSVPVLLPITKASLWSNSFLSGASFQETTKVLTDAAIAGKRDELSGLKENVIAGLLVKAGTGFVMQKLFERAEKERNAQLMDEMVQEVAHEQNSNCAAATA